MTAGRCCHSRGTSNSGPFTETTCCGTCLQPRLVHKWASSPQRLIAFTIQQLSKKQVFALHLPPTPDKPAKGSYCFPAKAWFKAAPHSYKKLLSGSIPASRGELAQMHQPTVRAQCSSCTVCRCAAHGSTEHTWGVRTANKASNMQHAVSQRLGDNCLVSILTNMSKLHLQRIMVWYRLNCQHAARNSLHL